MNLFFRVLLCVALAQMAWGDTVHLKDRGTEINGTVTFSNGTFRSWRCSREVRDRSPLAAME